MLTQMSEKIISTLKSIHREDVISKVLIAISFILSHEGATEITTLDKDLYQKLVSIIEAEIE
jgi:hypothetical protein